VEISDTYPYRVVVGRKVLTLVRELLPDVKPCLAVVGKGIAENAPWVLEELGEAFKDIVVIDDGEKAKELDTALHIVEALWRTGADRWCALGVASGGSLGDTAAFAASVYMRGIPLVMYPTTLLSMIDSALGGKTAVNWRGYKNVLGTFYHPSLVISDLRFLDTLPERVFRASLAEALKYGFTLDANFLSFLLLNKDDIFTKNDVALRYLVLRSSEIKLNVVKQDPRERKGIREVLNFGHTVGHALESASNFHLLHGEAVALGMLVEAFFAERKGFCRECGKAVKDALDSYGLTTTRPPVLEKEEYHNYILRDKKRRGDRIRLPVLTGVGSWKLVFYPVKEFVDTTYEILEELFWLQ